MSRSRTIRLQAALAAFVTTLSSGAQAQTLYAPGASQGYDIVVAGTPVLTTTSYGGTPAPVVDYRFKLGGQVFDYRARVNPSELQFRTGTSFTSVEYAAGEQAKLQAPGGVLSQTGVPQNESTLSTARIGADTRIVAYFNSGSQMVSLVALQNNAGMLRVVSTAVDSLAPSTNTVSQMGVGTDGSWVVAGGATKTRVWAFSPTQGLTRPAQPEADNPPGYQYLASGPSPTSGAFWVAMVGGTTTREVRIFQLTVSTAGPPVFTDPTGQTALTSLGQIDRVLAAFRSDGERLVILSYSPGGTKVRVGTWSGTALVFSAEKTGPNFSSSLVTPPVAIPDTLDLGLLLGREPGDQNALYSIDLSATANAGNITKLSPTGGSIASGDQLKSVTTAPPDRTTVSLTPLSASIDSSNRRAALTVQLAGALERAVTIMYSLTDVSNAGEGVDFTDCTSPPDSVTIPAGLKTATTTICIEAVAKTCREQGELRVALISSDSAVTVDGTRGTASITLTGSPAASITQQPQDQQVTRNVTATLTVVANGSGLSYQWFQGDSGNTSQPITGATVSRYTTPPITRTSRFWVQVRDACTSRQPLQSRTATITVPGPGVPELSASPPAVNPGGTSTLTWDWRSTGAVRAAFEPPLPGIQTVPTQGSAATPPLTATTSYTLKVFDADNQDNSNTVTITVAPRPSISSFTATSGQPTSTLNWNVANATSARIDPLGDITGQLPIGSRQVTLPEGVTTFTLTAKGVGPDAVASRVVSTPCVQNDTTLCLRGDRFRVTGTFELENNGGSGPLHFGRFDGGVSGYFHYDNPRVIQGLIKMPDFTCGATGTYWVFVGGATDQKVDLTFLDTFAPETPYTISNPSKRPLFLNPQYRFDAFRTCDVTSSVLRPDDPYLDSAPSEAPAVYQASPLATPCVEGPTTLCLSAGRFKLEGTYETQDSGPKGALVFRKFPGVDTSAVFSFAHSQGEVQGLITLPDNFCDVINRQSWWLIMAGLTDQGLQLKATDLTTGEVKNVASNPVKSDWKPQADFSFFPKVTFGQVSTNLPPEAGSGKLSFDVSTDCAGWTATVLPDGEWLTVNPASGPPGPAELTYSYGALSGNPRTATVRISWFGGQRSKDFTFTQSPPDPCRFGLSRSEVSFNSSANVGTFTVTAVPGCRWVATKIASWITIIAPLGVTTGNGDVQYRIEASDQAEIRTGTITVRHETLANVTSTFTINQQGQCSYSIDPEQYTAPAGGTAADEPAQVLVTATTGCKWTASSTVAWIKNLNPSTEQTGSGTPGALNFTVEANAEGTSRTGFINVAGKSLEVTQPACAYPLVPFSNNSVPPGGAVGLTFSVNAPAGCPWTAATTDTWITVTAGGPTVGPGTVTYDVAPNTTGAGRAPGTITVGTASFTVTQNACGYDLKYAQGPTQSDGPIVVGVDAVNNNGPVIGVVTTDGCPWTLAIQYDASTDWITIDPPLLDGVGPSLRELSIKKNDTDPLRVRTATVGFTSPTVATDTMIVRQCITTDPTCE